VPSLCTQDLSPFGSDLLDLDIFGNVELAVLDGIQGFLKLGDDPLTHTAKFFQLPRRVTKLDAIASSRLIT
jgi:hypothetical protein